MNDHKLQMLHSSEQADWRTPPELYTALARTFAFDVDLAATLDSCLVLREGEKGVNAYYLGPDHTDLAMRDALQVPWHTLGTVGFLNPPYSLSLYSDGLKAGVVREDLQWLLIENWARKAFNESEAGFTTIGVFPYAPQTEWFRFYVMGHGNSWRGHAALDYWKLPHRVSFLRANGEPAANANVNTCIVIWGPNPGFVGPWVPSGRYWTYR